MSAGPTRALGVTRGLLRDSWTTDLSKQLLAEIQKLAATGDSRDAANAIASFVAKRRPQFEGR